MKIHSQIVEDAQNSQNDSKVKIRPSELCTKVIKIPVVSKLESFSFLGRKYWIQIYDDLSQNVLVKAGRQVGKSTFIGIQSLIYDAVYSYFQVLYTAPTYPQVIYYSDTRLNTLINNSDLFKSIKGKIDNKQFKEFINGSVYILRPTFRVATESLRGTSSDMIIMDEMQDHSIDTIPVLQECNANSSYDIKRFAGTPKSVDNLLEGYWSKYSTQGEYCIPCKKHPFSYWNILGINNIGNKGLICDKCGNPINANDPECRWISIQPNPPVAAPFHGYRVPQLLSPVVLSKWSVVLDKLKTYPLYRFYNEVLALAYEAAARPVTWEILQTMCQPDISIVMNEGMRDYNYWQRYSRNFPIFMGIDHGSGENSFTLVSLGTYVGDDFIWFYFKRFEGAETQPQYTMDFVYFLVSEFNVKLIGVDYGGGFDRNDALIRKYGANRVYKYQELGNLRGKARWDSSLGRYLINRTEVMSDIFNALNRKNVFKFPRIEEFRTPFAEDILSIFTEYNESTQQIEYEKAAGATDDTFHSMMFCFLVSTLMRPRPDIFLPINPE